MTYNPAIPQSTDLISNSQPQILTNFGQLNTQYAADHDGLTTVTQSGMHNQVTFLANQAAPSLTRNGVAGVAGLYANTDGTNSQLFFQNASGSIPITGKSVAGANGYTTLPGGLILKWGAATGLVDNSLITFPVAFPTGCYTVNICGYRGNASERSLWVSSGTVTASGFHIRTSSTGIDLQYIAIGY